MPGSVDMNKPDTVVLQTKRHNSDTSQLDSVSIDGSRITESTPAISQNESLSHHTTPDSNGTAFNVWTEWMKVIDPKTNRHYYYNKKTRETTWKNPVKYPPQSKEQEQLEITDDAVWFEVLDKNTGAFYYFNKATRETTWEAPKNAVIIRGNPSQPSESSKPPTMGSKTQILIKPSSSEIGKSNTSSNEKNRKEAIDSIREAVFDRKTIRTDNGQTIKLESNLDEDDEKMNPVLPIKKQYLFYSYAKKHFNLHRKGLFKSPTSIDKAISWKPIPIKTPLLELNSSLKHDAVLLNKLIKRFTNGHKSEQEQYSLLQRIIGIVLQGPREMIDELYCQIMKELTKCPKGFLINTWKLFSVVSGSVIPTEELYPYIQYYAVKQQDNESESTKYASYVSNRLNKCLALGRRIEIPTIAELAATLNQEKVLVRFYLLDESFVTIPCDSCTCVEDICNRMVKKLKLETDGPLFSLYEIMPERLLSPKERILDVVRNWQNQYIGENESEYDGGYTFQFIFKAVLYVDINPNIKPSLYLIYTQGVFDVTNDHYRCSRDDDFYTLAALALQVRFGDYTGLDQDISEYVRDVIPMSLMKDEATFKETKTYVMTLYSKLQGYSWEESILAYLDYIKSWELYGCYYFFLEPSDRNDFPASCFLAVGPRGIIIGDAETNAILRTIPYSSIPSWGYSAQAFVMHVGTLVQQEKMIFLTIQGQEINNLMNSYMQYLVSHKSQSTVF
ncbi:hypothetical protein WA158_004354 [Blastocystis sp. Blastoise]